MGSSAFQTDFAGKARAMLKLRFNQTQAVTPVAFQAARNIRISCGVVYHEGQEVARNVDGFWHVGSQAHISLEIDAANIMLHFEEEGMRSEDYGPFNHVKIAGGSLWTDPPHELMARCTDDGDGSKWHVDGQVWSEAVFG
jgi:hypothetical protein